MTSGARNASLTNAEIIRLYEKGLSQQDIHRLHSCSITKIRTVLQDAGYNTAVYRKIPLEYEEVIHVLLRARISYHAIAEATDISYHAIREIAERRSNKTVEKTCIKKPKRKTEREAMFLHYYLSGQSFCALCVFLGLSKNEICRCYTLLDEAAIQTHRRALRSCLYAEDLSQNSISSLARKYGVSTSTIKAHLNI